MIRGGTICGSRCRRPLRPRSVRDRSPRVGPPEATCSSSVFGPRDRSGRSFRSCSCRSGRSGLAGASVPSAAPDRFRPRPPRRRRRLGASVPPVASPLTAATSDPSGCASSRWLSGVCSRSFSAAPLRPRPPRVPGRRGRPSSAPSSSSVRVRARRASAASTVSSSRVVDPPPPRPRPPRPRPPRLRRRGAVGPFSPASAGVPWLVSSDPVRLAGRARRARLLWRPIGGLGGRLTRRVGRPLEDRGEAVRRRRLTRRSLGLSIHVLLPSLGARGRTGSETDGCGGAVLRDERSVTGAAAIAAHRDEDLLVQLSVLSGGRAACLAIPRRGRRRRRAPPHSLLSPPRAALLAAGPAGARLCIEDNSPLADRTEPTPGTRPGGPPDPMASPLGTNHPRCELVIPS